MGIKENQKKRFCDEGMVDKIVEADNWNKLKNMASKAIGEKMKKKEPVGDSDSLEDSLVEGLSALSLEQCQGLTVTQIKRIRVLIDEAIEKNKVKMEEMEKSRDSILGEM